MPVEEIVMATKGETTNKMEQQQQVKKGEQKNEDWLCEFISFSLNVPRVHMNIERPREDLRFSMAELCVIYAI